MGVLLKCSKFRSVVQFIILATQAEINYSTSLLITIQGEKVHVKVVLGKTNKLKEVELVFSAKKLTRRTRRLQNY